MKFIPETKFARERLAQFISDSLADYQENRNFDLGPDKRTNVSMLSPYICRKVITEKQIVDSVLQRNRGDLESKFIQEVLWRTYWKGWLNGREKIWHDYQNELSDLKIKLEIDSELKQRYQQAVSGKTGIEYFDQWAKELVEHGYLHNHARMWFASIWIFTLGLPWQLGANFFYFNLYDADPASNTLSWRWVAGLHTKGKYYLASDGNIRKFTKDRFKPSERLAKQASPIKSEKAETLFESNNLPETKYPEKGYALLLHEEQMLPELKDSVPDSIIVFAPDLSEIRSKQVQDFSKALQTDCIKEISQALSVNVEYLNSIKQLEQYCNSNNIKSLYTPFCPTGYTRQLLFPESVDLTGKFSIFEVLGQWEKTLYPLADRGFFSFYEKAIKLIKSSLI